MSESSLTDLGLDIGMLVMTRIRIVLLVSAYSFKSSSNPFSLIACLTPGWFSPRQSDLQADALASIDKMYMVVYTYVADTGGRGVFVSQVPYTSFAQWYLIVSEAVERLVPLVAVVLVVEAGGERGTSGIDDGKSEKLPEEGDCGDVGDAWEGRWRSNDLCRRPGLGLRSPTGLGVSALLFDGCRRPIDMRPSWEASRLSWMERRVFMPLRRPSRSGEL